MIEKFPAPEQERPNMGAPDRFKLETALILELLESGNLTPRSASEKDPITSHAEVNLAGVVKILESHDIDFASLKKAEEDIESRFSIDVKEMGKRMAEKVRYVEGVLKSLELLPEAYTKNRATTAPISLKFDPTERGGGFIPDKEKPSIHLGGKMVKKLAARFQDGAKIRGVEMADDTALDLAVSASLGHEMGHYIHSLSEEDHDVDLWFSRANESRTDVDWVEDEFDRRMIFEEWISQSIGYQILDSSLAARGITTEVKDELRQLFIENADTIVFYQRIASWAKQRQMPAHMVANAMIALGEQLKDAGREDLAERLSGGSFHFVGYCLDPLKSGELRSIMREE